MNAPTPGETLYRPRLMTLLHTALNLGETRFTRRLALSWLASYPGDLPVSLLNTRALFVEGHLQQVIDILEKVCQVDIEYLEAYELLARAYKFTGIEVNTDLFFMCWEVSYPPELFPPGLLTYVAPGKQTEWDQ